MLSPEESIAQLREATKSVTAQTNELREAREARERERSIAAKETAEARKRGEHGKDWQVLQQRIDLGQTSEFDIIQGFDHSVEARNVRKQMGESIGKVADERAKQVSQEAQLPEDFKRAQAELADTVARLRGLIP